MSAAGLLKAQRAHGRQDWAEAARAYEAYIAASQDLSPLVALGDVYVELGDRARARDSYLRKLQHDPLDATAARRLGVVARELGDHTAALRAFRRAFGTAEDPPRAPWGDGQVRLPVRWAALERLFAAGWLSRAQTGLHTGGADYGLPGDVEGFGFTPLASDPPPSRVDLVVVAMLDTRPPEGQQIAAGERALRRAAAATGAAAPALVVGYLGDSFPGAPHRRPGESPVLRLGLAEDAPLSAVWALGVAVAQRFASDVLLLRPGVGRRIEAGLERLAPGLADPMVGFGVVAEAASGEPVYGPAVSGDAVFVRARVLEECGGFDALYQSADAALVDMASRANRAGFTALHMAGGEPAGAHIPALDARILKSRYPELAAAQRRRPDAREPLLARARLQAQPRLLLDLSMLSPSYGGIAEVSVALADAIDDLGRVELHVRSSLAAAKAHGLERFSQTGRLVPVGPTRPRYSACLRTSQPLSRAQMVQTWAAAPVSGFLMHDAIAMDCEYLNPGGFHALWAEALDGSDLLGFVSGYSRDQFARRYPDADLSGSFVARNSTAAGEYARLPVEGAGPATGVLVVGNAFAHKNLEAAVSGLIERAPDLPISVLGMVRSPSPQIRWYESGGLTPREMDALYLGAEAIIYPSLYEGFGLPIMHALGRGRPVLAIDQPVFREIKARSQLGANIHLFPSTPRLLDAAAGPLPAFTPADPRILEHSWRDAAELIVDAVERAIAAFDRGKLARRLASLPAAPGAAQRAGVCPSETQFA